MSHPVSAASEPSRTPQLASAATPSGPNPANTPAAFHLPPAGLLCLPNAEDLAQIVFAAERLGLVGRSDTVLSLMSALTKRDFVTSNHSTRVAVWCATMARVLEQPPGEQAVWTVAAMLHDIGKIGVPDSILLKDSSLTHAEAEVMARRIEIALEMLEPCGFSPVIVDIIANSHGWYDGSRPGPCGSGPSLPTGARLLAIADAFDAMTTERRYRKAMTPDESLTVLRGAAGKQFDPELVEMFASYVQRLPRGFLQTLPGEWLRHGRELVGRPSPEMAEREAIGSAMRLFSETMTQLDEAVCVVDRSLRVHIWNPQAERLTGRSAEDVVGQVWTGQSMQDTVGLFDSHTRHGPLLARCLATAKPLRERGYLHSSADEWKPVESRAVPIYDRHQRLIGAVEIFRDLSRELSLQAENQSLRQLSSTDPLTQVDNRAGFDSLIQQRIAIRRETGEGCALIMADLDHFKWINDTFGHLAGDAVLKAFAALLKRSCRPGDVVARYGGEEFGVILPGCNIKTAYERAEVMRQQLVSMVCKELPGRQLTASFGVTELEDDDTESSFVGRADEALYQSKQKGRNRIESARWTREPATEEPRGVACECSSTWVVSSPGEITYWKIRGFLLEQQAKLLELSPSRMRVSIGQVTLLDRLRLRRKRARIELEIALSHMHISPKTLVRATIQVLHCDNSPEELQATCRLLLNSLRSYLMGDEPEQEALVTDN